MKPIHKSGPARVEVNRAGELEAFVQVVDRGGFSAAARHLGLTPSAISKLVARLEARLSVQLVHRSTRKLQLTAEGQLFYERGLRVLADLDEAERCVGAGAAPRGRVSINASIPFGHRLLLPLVPRLLEAYPELQVDVVLTDRVVDLMEERCDIAIRWGKLPPSDLVGRLLGHTAQAIVGSPDYLARQGTPTTVEELARHNRLGSTYRRNVPDWPLVVDGRAVAMPVVGSARASDGAALRLLAMEGVGLARLSVYHVLPDLRAGRLVPVMEAFNPHELEPLHAVYLGRPGRLPARVRAVLDFLAAKADFEGADRVPVAAA